MQTPEQMSSTIIQHGQDITMLKHKVETLEKRVDINDDITRTVHSMAANIQSISEHIQKLYESFGKLSDRVSTGFQDQGKRIGQLETATIGIGNVINTLSELTKRIEAIEKEPAEKWKKLIAQIIAAGVAVGVGFIAARLGLGG